MISTKEIQATCDDIVREFAPLQVILFGSYAYGTPTDDSDVDMLVVMAMLQSETRRQELDMKRRIPTRFRLDLHVRSPEDIAYRVSHNDWFFREILEKGDVLYENQGALPPHNGELRLAEKAVVPVWEMNGSMNPLTLELVQKAEADYASVKLHLQHLSTPGFLDIICFHLQQCIEKYLKAWLQEANIRPPRTHDLNELLALIAPTHPEWRRWHSDFGAFTKYAVDGRYPAYFATAADVAHAVRIGDEVRSALRSALGLSIDTEKDDEKRNRRSF